MTILRCRPGEDTPPTYSNSTMMTQNNSMATIESQRRRRIRKRGPLLAFLRQRYTYNWAFAVMSAVSLTAVLVLTMMCLSTTRSFDVWWSAAGGSGVPIEDGMLDYNRYRRLDDGNNGRNTHTNYGDNRDNDDNDSQRESLLALLSGGSYYGSSSAGRSRSSSYNSNMGRRQHVRRNEFFQPALTAREIDHFFRFDPTQLNSKADDAEFAQVSPLWTCGATGSDTITASPTSRPTKLVYIHMSRSAGTFIRALLRGFAEFCQAGLQLVTDCVDLSLENMQGDDFWRTNMMAPDTTRDRETNNARADAPCQVVYSANRSGAKFQGGPASSARLLDYDILGGRIPLGAADFWKAAPRAFNATNAAEAAKEYNSLPPVPVRYVTVFREPLEKLVSHLLYVHAHQQRRQQLQRLQQSQTNTNRTAQLPPPALPTVRQGVALLAEHVEEHYTRQGEYSDQYSSYLITPFQKHWVTQQNSIVWTPAQRSRLSRRNLLDRKVVVGIVGSAGSSSGKHKNHNFEATLDLFRYMLDGDVELTSMFDFFQRVSANLTAADRKGTSSRPIIPGMDFPHYALTKAIVEQVVNNDAIIKSEGHNDHEEDAKNNASLSLESQHKLREYLKYDVEIYETAVRIHELQYEWLVQSQQSSSWWRVRAKRKLEQQQ